MIMDTLQSRDRVEPGSHDIPLGEFPPTSVSSPENPGAIASDIINQLNESLAAKDSGKIAALFIENCYWRDHLCYSWDFRTINGAQAISAYVTEPKTPCKIEIDHSSAFRAPHTGPIDAFGDVLTVSNSSSRSLPHMDTEMVWSVWQRSRATGSFSMSLPL